MSYLSATQIHNGKQWIPEGSVIEVAVNGTIKTIHAAGVVPEENVKHYEGILCPGFVNVHCHLELSHMKGRIEEGNGLVPFLKSVMLYRNSVSASDKEEALLRAIHRLNENGIVAVGDIANSTETLKHRPSAGFHIHTFVESTGFTELKAAERFSVSETIYRQFAGQSAVPGRGLLRQSIVPHAPYSVSTPLLSLIDRFDTKSLISIHNEETRDENDFYSNGTGGFNHFYETLRIDHTFFKPSGTTSLQTLLPLLSEEHPLILVHNTFMEDADLQYLKQNQRQVFLCLCPNANWYIERRLPPVDKFIQSGLPVCIGTDSLSSNHDLSILSELQTIQQHYKNVPLEDLLIWATYNGACALDMQHIVGSLEPGKQPGIVHIRNMASVKLLYSSSAG